MDWSPSTHPSRHRQVPHQQTGQVPRPSSHPIQSTQFCIPSSDHLPVEMADHSGNKGSRFPGFHFPSRRISEDEAHLPWNGGPCWAASDDLGGRGCGKTFSVSCQARAFSRPPDLSLDLSYQFSTDEGKVKCVPFVTLCWKHGSPPSSLVGLCIAPFISSRMLPLRPQLGRRPAPLSCIFAAPAGLSQDGRVAGSWLAGRMRWHSRPSARLVPPPPPCLLLTPDNPKSWNDAHPSTLESLDCAAGTSEPERH